MTDSRPDYEEAVARVIAAVPPLGATERIDLSEAFERVLAESVTADRDLPPFDRAQMDGYAVRSAEVGRQPTWPVTRSVPAGAAAGPRVPPGACVSIATGAAVPPEFDAVIPHEESDRQDPVSFTIDRVKPGRAIHPRGADAHAGDVLVAAGVPLGASGVGLAAAVGLKTLLVARRPRVSLLTTGDEVRPVDEPVAEHQIRNSNAPQTMILVRRAGGRVVAHRHVADDLEATAAAFAAAVSEADLVVTTGGVSVGERDHLPRVMADAGVTTILAGARIQPGKPIHVALHPSGTIVAGLPGNPVSALVTGILFVTPIVRCLLGADPQPKWIETTLATAVRPNPNRRQFRPACLTAAGHVEIPRWAGSGDLAHTAATDGIVELPPQEAELSAGARVRFLGW